jgi:MHS family proline/betaine transporter-like MFS transporter
VADPAMRQTIMGTAIGNFMEWYDFGVYGYIATTIAQVFYPGKNVSGVHLIATFGTLARPRKNAYSRLAIARGG